MANGALCCFQPPAEPAQAASPTPAVAMPSVRLGTGGRGEMLQGSQSFNMGLFLCIPPNFSLWGVDALGDILRMKSEVTPFCFCSLQEELFRARCAPGWSW